MSVIINEDGSVMLSNVIAVNQFGKNKHYTTTITIKEIGQIMNNKRITYDGEAQRGFKNGAPLIDTKHVFDICSSFKQGKIIPGHLTWNIRKLSNNGHSYNNNHLTINSKQLITLPDSAHRHKAFEYIYNENNPSNNDVEYVLDIYNMDFQEEKVYFSDYNGSGKAVCNNRIKALSDKNEDVLIKNIIQNSNLDNKVELVFNDASKKLVKLSTIRDSFFHNTVGEFKNLNINPRMQEYITNNKNKNSRYTLGYFVEFYNELLNSRPEFNDYLNKKKIKEHNMVLEEIAWYGYASLCSKLVNVPEWKSILYKLMNNKVKINKNNTIDWLSKENPIWNSTRRLVFDNISQTSKMATGLINSNITRKVMSNMFVAELQKYI